MLSSRFPLVLFLLGIPYKICAPVLSQNLRRSDDTSTESLEALIQQQASTIVQQSALIKILQNDVSTIKTQLSKTVAFTATLQGGTGISIGEHSTIKFDNVVTNTGNGYDRATGVFTAPAAGIYAFFLAVRATRDTIENDFGIEKSGIMIAQTFVNSVGGMRGEGSVFVTVHLNVSDHVNARHISGGNSLDRWYGTMFSGVLISAD